MTKGTKLQSLALLVCILGTLVACGEAAEEEAGPADLGLISNDGKADTPAIDVTVEPGEVGTVNFESDMYGLVIEATQAAEEGQPHHIKVERAHDYSDITLHETESDYAHEIKISPNQLEYGTTYSFILTITNEGEGPLTLSLAVRPFDDYDPCVELQDMLYNYQEPVSMARCNLIEEPALSSSKFIPRETDVCVLRGVVTEENFDHSGQVGDEFARLWGSLLTTQTGDSRGYDWLRIWTSLTHPSDSASASETDDILEFSSQNRGYVAGGNGLTIEQRARYNKIDHTVDILLHTKEDGFFNRWKTQLDFRVSCEVIPVEDNQ